MKRVFLFSVSVFCVATGAFAQRPKGCISQTPYIGAIIVDADTGATLFEDKADAPGYPASTLKLMTLLVVQEQIDAALARNRSIAQRANIKAE